MSAESKVVAYIHDTAVIAPGARIAKNVEIGPYSVIGDNVEIGEGTRIGPHVVIHGWTSIGKDCRIFQFASFTSTAGRRRMSCIPESVVSRLVRCSLFVTTSKTGVKRPTRPIRMANARPLR